jgi:hypothetical protein
MRLKICVSAFVCLALVACLSRVNKGGLAGTYFINLDGVSDVLELESTGQYNHRYDSEDEHHAVDTGTWDLETVEGHPTVVLHNFRSPLREVKAFGSGYFLMRVTSSFGRTRLWVDDRIFYKQEAKTQDKGRAR